MEFLNNVRKLLEFGNNVDKLLTDKVNDFTLVEEQPCVIDIGNRKIVVGNFTLDNNYRFFSEYGTLMAHLGLKYLNFDHLGSAGELQQLCLTNKKWYKGLLKIISNTLLKQQAYYLNEKKEREKIKWKNCDIGYFKKHVSVEKLMQIILIIYLYNFDAEKKNFKILVSRQDMSKLTETYMYSWLVSLPGLTGGFQTAQCPKPEWLDKEYQKLKEDIKTKPKLEKTR